MENYAFLMVKYDTPLVIEKLHKDIDPEDVYEYGKTVGEPKQTSGKQELYEAIVAMYA